jgi:copper transport protein
VLAALCATLLVPAEARAHGHLRRARPAAGDTVRIAPRFLRLEFSEAPELGVSSIRLLDSLAREIRLLPLRTDVDSAQVLIADIAGHLAPGRYTVMWQMVGRDGHPVHGQYDFVFVYERPAGLMPAPIAGPPGTRRTAPPVPSQTHLPDGFDSESRPYVFVRWVHFMGLLVVIGGAAFYWLVLGRVQRTELTEGVVQESTARARRFTTAGAVLLALAAIGRLLAQWTALRLSVLDPSTMPLSRVVGGSAWGHAWLLEIAALAAAGLGLTLAARARSARLGWSVVALATIGLALSAALSGHAAVPETAVPLVADMVHVLAAGSWMGALLVLLGAGLPAARAASAPARAMTALVNAFSSTALVSASVVVLTGIVATVRNVDDISALLQSPYGRVLLVKLGVLVVAALFGLYNWRRAQPALAATGNDAAMVRAIRAELTAAAVILLVTAVLVATPTPVDLVSMR